MAWVCGVQAILTFLSLKEARNESLGNLEINARKALTDTATLMELAIMYIFSYEIVVPSMLCKEVFDDYWQLSDLYREVEKKVVELVVDPRPMLYGEHVFEEVECTLIAAEVELTFTYDEEGNVVCELVVVALESVEAYFNVRTRHAPFECIFGPAVRRPRSSPITHARDFLIDLPPARQTQALALLRAGLVAFMKTFQKFAAPQLKSQGGTKTGCSIHQGGTLLKEDRRFYNFNHKLKVRIAPGAVHFMYSSCTFHVQQCT